MQHKLNLRKLNAVNTEIQGTIRVKKREAKNLQKVVLRAHQTEDLELTVANAKAERLALFAETSALQVILSRFRAVVAAKNLELGITATLQELRETEDRLGIVTDFLVEPTKSPDYDGYVDVKDAVAQIRLYEDELEKDGTVRRRLGKSDAAVRLVSDESVAAEVKALQRKVKEIKNDRLVALNFKEVSVELTEQEKELLESFNIL